MCRLHYSLAQAQFMALDGASVMNTLRSDLVDGDEALGRGVDIRVGMPRSCAAAWRAA